MVSACAVEGRAGSVFTGDKDLLSLDAFQGTAIITPEDFRQCLRGAQ